MAIYEADLPAEVNGVIFKPGDVVAFYGNVEAPGQQIGRIKWIESQGLPEWKCARITVGLAELGNVAEAVEWRIALIKCLKLTDLELREALELARKASKLKPLWMAPRQTRWHL